MHRGHDKEMARPHYTMDLRRLPARAQVLQERLHDVLQELPGRD